MAQDLTLAVRITGDAGNLKAEVVGATGGLDEMGRKAEEAGRRGTAGFEGLERAAARVATVVTATALAALTATAKAGDELTATMGRLQTATGSLQGATRAYEELYKISLATGIAVNESASAFTRFAIAAREAGASQGQVLAIVKGLQQAGALAGASTAETAAATQQLAQALASGKLQGDELRSVLENMPNLAEKLAKELGVGIGQLRKMGEEGKLTADVVLPALQRAAEKLNDEYEKLPPTMARGFGQLTVAATNFLGQLDKAIGLSNALARALAGAASALDGLRQRVGLGTDRENAAAGQYDAQGRVGALRSQISATEAMLAPRGEDDPTPNVVGIQRQIAQRNLVRLREELRAAEGVLTEALRNRNQVERGAEAESDAQAYSAEQKRIAEQRQRDAEALKTLQETLDKKVKTQREYQDRVTEIEGLASRGRITTAQRDELLAQAAAKRDEALREGASRGAATRQGQSEEAKRLLEELKKAQQEAEDWQRTLDDQSRRLASIGLDRSLIGATRGDAAVQRARLTANQELDRRRTPVSDDQRSIYVQQAEDIARASTELERQQGIFGELTSIGTNAFERIGSAITKAMVDGKTAMVDFKSVGKAVVSELAQEFLKLALLNPIKNAISGNGNLATLADLGTRLFGGGVQGNAVTAFPNPTAPLTFHTGGIVGADAVPARGVPFELFREAPRYHQGGFIGPGEVPAILRRGEGVFTPEQMSNLGPAGNTSIAINWTGDAGNDDDRRRLAEAVAAAVARREISRATPGIMTATKGSLVDDVGRGGETARLFGRR